MNVEDINKTWRQAISYAINYTYMIEELKDGTVFRSNYPLAPNFPRYDPTIKAATYNLTKAREIVTSMGFGDMPVYEDGPLTKFNIDKEKIRSELKREYCK